MIVSFISYNDTGEMYTFLAWSDNEEFRSGNETNGIIKRLDCMFLSCHVRVSG